MSYYAYTRKNIFKYYTTPENKKNKANSSVPKFLYYGFELRFMV